MKYKILRNSFLIVVILIIIYTQLPTFSFKDNKQKLINIKLKGNGVYKNGRKCKRGNRNKEE